MTALPQPSQVLSSPLPAAPAQVWAHICQSGFIASYLGASLPAADLAAMPMAPGATLQGRAQGGQALALSVTSRLAPSSLSLCLRTAGEASLLHLSVSACAGGSRLTLLHQPLPAGAGPALVDPSVAGSASPGMSPADPALADLAMPVQQRPAAADGLARALATALPAGLQAGPPDDAAALQAAAVYLAGTADLVAQLRLAMGPRQGYAQPAGGGFSLVQHLWHLADVEQHGWSQRFLLLRSAASPVLPGVDGDRLAVEGRYQQRPWRAAAARFIRLRRHSLAALQRCDLALLRRPVLFGGQSATGADVLAAMLAHDHEHRVEMAALWPPAHRTA